MKQPNSIGSRTFEVNRIRLANTNSPVKRGKSRGIVVAQNSMQQSPQEETKVHLERPD